MNGKDTNLLTPRRKTCRINPSRWGLPVLKAVHSHVFHKLSRKTFWHFVPDVWKKTPTCSHRGGKRVVYNVYYTPILARASSSESGTLGSFVINLAGKPFWYDILLNTVHYTILARAFRSESSIFSRFVTNLAGKSTDDSVPDVRKRHQLAHTAPSTYFIA